MLLGKYYVSAHALERYDERVQNKGSVLKSIKRDLRTMNLRHIIRNGDSTHVFTKNFKEFIFVKDRKGVLCLKTIIKRNLEDTQLTIEKRKAVASN